MTGVQTCALPIFYFIDWDHVRARHRQLNVTVMGTPDPINDRTYNNGEVVDTKRRYTPEEKAYDVHYELNWKTGR